MPEPEEFQMSGYFQRKNVGSPIKVRYSVMACVTSDGGKEALDTMKTTVYLQLLI